MRLLKAILSGLWAGVRCLWLPGLLTESCLMMGDHPDIEQAQRTGYPRQSAYAHFLGRCKVCRIDVYSYCMDDRFSHVCECGEFVCHECRKFCVECNKYCGCPDCMIQQDGLYYCGEECKQKSNN